MAEWRLVLRLSHFTLGRYVELRRYPIQGSKAATWGAWRGLRLFGCPGAIVSLLQIHVAVNDFSRGVAEPALVPASRIRRDRIANTRHSDEDITHQATNRRQTLGAENERHSWHFMLQHWRHGVRNFQPYCDHQEEGKGM